MSTMTKTIQATVFISEDENCLVSFTIRTEAGEIAAGSRLGIGKACQEIGAALYEADHTGTHYHVAKYSEDGKLTDQCGECGRDLRDSVHKRQS